VDRYWAVTNVDYIHHRNAKRIGLMIITIWIVAAIVSLAPNFGWKDPNFKNRIEIEKRCLVSQNVGYQIFATVATFYGPLVLILVLYWKIYQVLYES
jgi:5-hydroxytryptamine receptor 1